VRPHVELIHEDDYVRHGAELPGGEGQAEQWTRRMVRPLSGWTSPRTGRHDLKFRGPRPGHVLVPSRQSQARALPQQRAARCVWLIRSDGELINWYTTLEYVTYGGDAEKRQFEAGADHLVLPDALPLARPLERGLDVSVPSAWEIQTRGIRLDRT